jgi:pimeloyl-ACP methyl ester carboxylesterase
MALGGCATPQKARPASNNVATESSAQAVKGPQDQVSRERVYSPARNTAVELITIRPLGVSGVLQVCLALHGKGNTAAMFLDLGVPEMLTALVNAGVPPFAVVSVDGGDNYWTARNGDDPQGMLTRDIPTWLGNRSLGTLPFSVLGISMGAYGALNYARNPGLSACAVISAALFDNWTDAKARNAFADQAQWEATEPLRHLDTVSTVPLGVWCGTGDPFVAQSRELVNKGKPRISAIGAGAHDETYWRRVLPDALRFVGETLP